jgi:hypothetical protein
MAFAASPTSFNSMETSANEDEGVERCGVCVKPNSSYPTPDGGLKAEDCFEC